MTKDDKRAFSRVSRIPSITLKTDKGETVSGDVLDISMTGVLARLQGELAPDTECEATIQLDGWDVPYTVEAPAIVIRTGVNGTALDFPAMPAQTFDELKNMILLNAADAQRAEEEIVSNEEIRRRIE